MAGPGGMDTAGSRPGRIRAATARDRHDLARLRWDWRVSWGEEPTMTFEDFAEGFASWFDTHAASHVAFVAEVAEEIVGTGGLAVVERIPGPGDWTRLSGHVQNLYVDPAHRRVGLGEELVDALVAEGRARGLAYLAVHPSERSSFPLYRRAGFNDTDRVLELRL
jgi:ribosomal protein S18 acetylase RimI-like enzyme